MEQEKTTINTIDNNKCKNKNKHMGGGGGALYGIGLVGALVYFIQHADTLWAGVLGVLKAIIWPALFVYKFLDFLKF